MRRASDIFKHMKGAFSGLQEFMSTPARDINEIYHMIYLNSLDDAKMSEEERLAKGLSQAIEDQT